MGVRSGVDIVQISRVQSLLAKYGTGFTDKFMLPQELDYCDGRVEKIAARWAAKEAFLKALGTGFMNRGVQLKDVEVVSMPAQAPQLRLSGVAAELLQELPAADISLSLSHDGDYAVAFCVLSFSDN